MKTTAGTLGLTLAALALAGCERTCDELVPFDVPGIVRRDLELDADDVTDDDAEPCGLSCTTDRDCNADHPICRGGYCQGGPA